MTLNPSEFEITIADKFAKIALECIFREYPHCGLSWMESDDDLFLPRQLHPVFYGCLDWHSAVHNHWLLVRLVRWFPKASFTSSALATLALSLTPEKISREVAYLEPRPTFECPYGLVWLLQLAAELREWSNSQGATWITHLEPLETIAAQHLQRWLKYLTLPNRTGSHQQTAFALGLLFDWAKVTQDQGCWSLIAERVQEFYQGDQNYPIYLEPLGYDFLSPALAEADLMRRLLPPLEFADWLNHFLPSIPQDHATVWLQPITANDPADYLQSHLDGLNLSRAWMLEGIIAGLPEDDSRLPALQVTANHHRRIGLAAVTADYYAGTHWLGSFAVYLLTRRGVSLSHIPNHP